MSNECTRTVGNLPDSDRRAFLKQSFQAVALGTTFQAFLQQQAGASEVRQIDGYGPLQPVKDESTGLELLQLPPGFRYASFGWTGDPMADGRKTPGSHDGMAVIAQKNGKAILCRNHECSIPGIAFGDANITYDERGTGGCTNLLFDLEAGKWEKAWPSLSGTYRNCAGGPTPWGTWLSCEETVAEPGDSLKGILLGHKRSHGWIFEVPAEGDADPVPLKDMGRFVHEAVAVDPQTGYVYETEDRGTAGFYRFLPSEKDRLTAGGRLQMLKAAGAADLRKGSEIGQVYDVEWVDIEDPERRHSPGTSDELGVFRQGKEQGGTTFARLEGCWYGNGLIYVNSTSGGEQKAGQVWQYDPRNEQLKLLFESPSPEVLDSPDNMAVSPRGGLIHCEDGKANPQRLHGMTPDGRLFPFAANNIVLDRERNNIRGDFRGQEWCGATFSFDGGWLFANAQRPGITFAITGPWGEGLL